MNHKESLKKKKKAGTGKLAPYTEPSSPKVLIYTTVMVVKAIFRIFMKNWARELPFNSSND